METLRIIRLNRMLELEPFDQNRGFAFSMTEYTGRFTVTGTHEVKLSLSLTQTDTIQMWELIDALTQPDVLHPVYRDIKISPFGDDGRFYLHIKWEGWHSDEIDERLSEVFDSEMRNLYIGLQNLVERAESIKRTIEEKAKQGEISEDTKLELMRKTANLLADSIGELLPESPWASRGLIGAPFRKLTLGKFNSPQHVSIRLSPSEARRFARVVRICSGHLIYF